MKKLILIALLTTLSPLYAEIISGSDLPSIESRLKQKSCFNNELTKESLACPGGEEIKALDTRYQTAGIFLSFIAGENESYLDQALSSLEKISYRGVVNIVVLSHELSSYQKFMTNKADGLKVNTHSYKDSSYVNVFKWLQDGLQFAYKDGAPVVIALNSIHEYSRAYDIADGDTKIFDAVLSNVHDRFAGQIAKSCNIELIYKEDTLKAESQDWSSGGNFTPLPGNNWTTAGNIYDYDDYPQRQEVLYPEPEIGNFPYTAYFFEPAQIAFVDTVGGGRNTIDIPTAYFGIGHIDESISFVPLATKEKGVCDFGILYADALAAHSILGVVAEDEFDADILSERNEFLADSVREFAGILEGKLGCKIKIESAPVATDIEMTDYIAGNQLNGLVIQDGSKTSFITSRVNNNALDTSFEKSLRKLNTDINYIPIEAGLYNDGTGGVHCATASIRVCR